MVAISSEHFKTQYDLTFEYLHIPRFLPFHSKGVKRSVTISTSISLWNKPLQIRSEMVLCQVIVDRLSRKYKNHVEPVIGFLYWVIWSQWPNSEFFQFLAFFALLVWTGRFKFWTGRKCCFEPALSSRSRHKIFWTGSWLQESLYKIFLTGCSLHIKDTGSKQILPVPPSRLEWDNRALHSDPTPYTNLLKT